MTDRTFAAWVEPVAVQLREQRSQVVAFARSLPAESWSRPCGDEGWTCKDVLAHVGKANDQLFQTILRELVAGRQIGHPILDIDTDGDNERRVAERRDWPVDKVVAELEEAGEEVQELLSQLTEEDKDYRQEDPPFILSGFVRLIEGEGHDLEHLAQVRAALEGDMGVVEMAPTPRGSGFSRQEKGQAEACPTRCKYDVGTGL